MIKAAELRIGNYCRRSIDLPAFPITANDIMELNKGFYNLHPVPITPEILEKCGFIKSDETYQTELYGKQLKTYAEETLILSIEFNFDKFSIILLGNERLSKNNFRLHQLQNIYFALSGEELEIKEL